MLTAIDLRYTTYVLGFRFAASILVAAAVLAAADPKPSDLTLVDLSGKKVRLRDYRGKIVVLNFWATWCGPCREEMPMIVEAEKTWGPKGVTFIAISLDDNKTRKNIPEFIERYHVDFPVWSNASTDDLDKLQMGQGVPDTAFLDEAGVVVARVLGQMHRAEIDERLTWLTGDRKSSPPPALINHF
ncbi:MAG: TlpA disulfide reductase family protein [Bryobacteraceae bacterium]